MKIKKPFNVYLSIGFGVLIVTSFFGYLYLFSEKKDIRRLRTHTSLTTQELFVKLESGENKNLEHFIDKAIEVKGVIKDITVRNGVYSIILDGNGGQRHILCEMQKGQDDEILKLKVGEEVVLKGVLKGFLIDAILFNCIIV